VVVALDRGGSCAYEFLENQTMCDVSVGQYVLLDREEFGITGGIVVAADSKDCFLYYNIREGRVHSYCGERIVDVGDITRLEFYGKTQIGTITKNRTMLTPKIIFKWKDVIEPQPTKKY